jgi:hypothetical protein
MGKVFSILSWNIRHLRDSPGRIDAVVKYIQKWDPDVFGLYEIEGKQVFDMMVGHFPEYSLFITEGQESQEILVACRRKFNAITFQQKKEFDTGNPKLRPGALLSFEKGGQIYGALFLHTDSGTDAVGFGNRAEMFRHAFNLKKALDKTYGNARLVILGDLNTMGLQYPRTVKSDTKVEGENEVFNLGTEARKVKMTVLDKEEQATWMGRQGTSNLDHIVASTALQFKVLTKAGQNFQVQMDGWNKITDKTEREKYLKTISDHCLLYAEAVE